MDLKKKVSYLLHVLGVDVRVCLTTSHVVVVRLAGGVDRLKKLRIKKKYIYIYIISILIAFLSSVPFTNNRNSSDGRYHGVIILISKLLYLPE